MTRTSMGHQARLFRAPSLRFTFIVTSAIALAVTACERSPEPSSSSASAAASAAPSPPRGPLPDATKNDVTALFAAYERARQLLANDQLVGLADEVKLMARHLRNAADKLPREDGAGRWLRAAAERTDDVASSSSLDEARERYRAASEIVVALGVADPKLREELRVFECPMVEGFNKWVQPSATLANPYMGEKMLACGSESRWELKPASSASPSTAHEGHGHDGDIAYYTCPMHPSVKQSEPGQCPLCGMDLAAVTKADLESGQLLVDDLRRQKIGVRTITVSKAPLATEIRTVGRVTFDERRLHDVNLKLGGWIERLHVDETGVLVKKGQVLFTLYSPELYAAQVELVSAQRAIEAAGDSLSKSLISAATRKLALWDVSQAHIDALKKEKVARRDMPIVSPARGHVIEKNVVMGSRIDVGQTVYRIADLSRVWVETEVYEADLPRVRVGQKARLTLSYLPGRAFDAEVTFISPVLDESTRTGRIRLEVPNEDLALKPNMFAEVTLVENGADALQVPREAVIYTGRRRLVFVDLGEGKLRPQVITVGRESHGAVEVLSGLEEGDVVVTSGNFLLAAESRLKNATRFWHDDETVAPPPDTTETPTPTPTPMPPPTPTTTPSPTPTPTHEHGSAP